MKDRSIDLTTFKKMQEAMIAKNVEGKDEFFLGRYRYGIKNYSAKEIDNIINSGSIAEQQKLSRVFYEKNGLYKRIILYYASILNYSGLLIPFPNLGHQLSTPHVQKKYNAALNYLEKANLVELMTRMSIRALVDGCYYGIIQTLDKNNFVLFDLPSGYARSRFRDIFGNDIVEFNVTYFDLFLDKDDREEVLSAYPTLISSYYRKYKEGKTDSFWIKLPADVGVCFSFFDDCRPLFLTAIPASIQYDEAVDTERERELEEIRKIIVQKVPHLTDGQLLFEPDEALEMHRGAVKMMAGNANLSVLTTYADVDAIISKTSTDNISNALEKMLQNVYAEAGVSGQVFAPTGSQALNIAIKNDIALMMILGNKYARFITFILNSLFANSNVSFKYIILPVGIYNQSEYISDMLKLAQSGYSYLQVAAAAGINQHELSSLKDLENNVLNLREVLIPLASSYTESSGEVGAPEKALEDKSPKTIQNEEALDHQGGLDNG